MALLISPGRMPGSMNELAPVIDAALIFRRAATGKNPFTLAFPFDQQSPVDLPQNVCMRLW
jgi:hypothetical protein